MCVADPPIRVAPVAWYGQRAELQQGSDIRSFSFIVMGLDEAEN